MLINGVQESRKQVYSRGGNATASMTREQAADYEVKVCGSQAVGGSGKRGSEPHVVDGGEGTESTVSRQLP